METDKEQPVISPDMQESALLKQCRACKHNISKNAKTCPYCGEVFKQDNYKSKIVAALFAFCLGGLGAHKFYLGKPTEGIFYILFVWTFIPAIISFIEGIYYLAVDEEEFDKKYNSDDK